MKGLRRTESQVVLAQLDPSVWVRDLLRLRGRVPGDVVPESCLPHDHLARVEYAWHPDITTLNRGCVRNGQNRGESGEERENSTQRRHRRMEIDNTQSRESNPEQEEQGLLTEGIPYSRRLVYIALDAS